MIGIPYAWGAPKWPRNTDCSSLTQSAYAAAGISIPRTSLYQFRACRYSTTAVGALIFFWTDDARPGLVTHVGINVGNGSMVNANSVAGRVVEENWNGSSYWNRRLIACASL
ncbi:MAG TPA: NlpC/P60 family protein [Pirellulaceae bacterium]|nr:NlpC/P60 family protein [Pirellulaceae bacterium]